MRGLHCYNIYRKIKSFVLDAEPYASIIGYLKMISVQSDPPKNDSVYNDSLKMIEGRSFKMVGVFFVRIDQFIR